MYYILVAMISPERERERERKEEDALEINFLR